MYHFLIFSGSLCVFIVYDQIKHHPSSSTEVDRFLIIWATETLSVHFPSRPMLIQILVTLYFLSFTRMDVDSN